MVSVSNIQESKVFWLMQIISADADEGPAADPVYGTSIRR
jgi:hypothetical protein